MSRRRWRRNFVSFGSPFKDREILHVIHYSRKPAPVSRALKAQAGFENPETPGQRCGYCGKIVVGWFRENSSMRLRDLIFVSLVVGGGAGPGRGVLRPSASDVVPRTAQQNTGFADLQPIVAEVDSGFRGQWAEKGIHPAAPAPELAIFRRLSLALIGSVPSLEEIRQFEARPAENRLEATLEGLLRDRRSADNLAERFARAWSVPRMDRSSSSAADGSPPGSVTRSWRTAPTTPWFAT